MAGSPSSLLAVPNVSEGRDHDVIDAIGAGFAHARLLDLHADADHHRSVFTLAAPPAALPEELLGGAREAVARIDLREHAGLHPRVGALDVMPVVYLDDADRGAACAAVLTAGNLIGDELGVPVVLYGELATRAEHRRRADLRTGGWEGLATRLESGDVVPDFGPRRAHPTAGVVLAAARPPLVAFNVDLDSDDVELARRIAAEPARVRRRPARRPRARPLPPAAGTGAGLDQRRGPPPHAAARGGGGRA